MRLLLKRGADPLFVHHSDKVVDGRGGELFQHRYETTTALMAAVGMGGGGSAWAQPDRSEREALTLDAVKIVVDLGVYVNAASTDGKTALDGARTLRYDSVIKYLTDHGAKSTPGARGQAAPPARD